MIRDISIIYVKCILFWGVGEWEEKKSKSKTLQGRFAHRADKVIRVPGLVHGIDVLPGNDFVAMPTHHTMTHNKSGLRMYPAAALSRFLPEVAQPPRQDAQQNTQNT